MRLETSSQKIELGKISYPENPIKNSRYYDLNYKAQAETNRISHTVRNKTQVMFRRIMMDLDKRTVSHDESLKLWTDSI